MPSEFLELASPQLVCLSCRHSVDGLRPNDAVPDVFAIARLTSLTRLELIEYHETCDCSALHNLPLKELLLLDCPLLPEALIVPGVFTVHFSQKVLSPESCTCKACQNVYHSVKENTECLLRLWMICLDVWRK